MTLLSQPGDTLAKTSQALGVSQATLSNRKKTHSCSSGPKRLRHAFIHEQHKSDYGEAWPVRALCSTLNVSRNGFCDYVRRLDEPGPQAARRAALAAKIQRVHADSRSAYRSPRIHQQLCDDGEQVNKKTVAKMMSAEDSARSQGLAACDSFEPLA